MKLRNLTLLIVGLVIASSTLADAGSHIGARVLSKQEFIDRLAPKPQIKTRGIRFNEPQAAPTISMEIRFEFDSAQLTRQSMDQLQPLGQALQSNELKNLAFMLEGHTDASGPEQYNMALSQRRAVAVGQYLYEKFGVASERLQLIGKGEHDLLQPNAPYSGVNRRVAITTLESSS